MADNDTPKDAPKAEPKKRSSGHAKTYARVKAYVVNDLGGSAAGVDDARLHSYISDDDWIAVVNHERAEADKDELTAAEALVTRPKLFTAKHVKADES